jgi:hypothetical protein
MNERIKALANESRLLTGWPVGEVEYQKFAELIIAECVNICEDLGTEGDGQHCVDAINNYFSNKRNT